MITSILEGFINKSNFLREEYFGLSIPETLSNVDANVLNPINAWKDKKKYDAEAKCLAQKFKDNFKLYGTEVNYLLDSGPLV